MNEWEPATEAEVAMRDALAATDQELYFRILARLDLLLPVSPDAAAGRAQVGWGTWTTGNRTHILAFTSPNALHLCLNDPMGSYRAVPFHALAAEWPNYEWWLAINPGLPIEAYLPSWFVSQLTRGGEVRLPGRTMGARARMNQSDLTAALGARTRAASAPGRPTDYSGYAPGTRMTPPPAAPPVAGPPAGIASPAARGSLFEPVSRTGSSGSTGSAAGPPRNPPPTNGHPPTPPAMETIDAEVIDYPPAAGSARVDAPGSPGGFSGTGYGSSSGRAPESGRRDGYESQRGYDNAGYERPGYDRPTYGYDSPRSYDTTPTSPFDGMSAPPPGGFFRTSTEPRDLGARLRERFGETLGGARYGGGPTFDFAAGGATGGFAAAYGTTGYAGPAAGSAAPGPATGYAGGYVEDDLGYREPYAEPYTEAYSEDDTTIRVVGTAPSSSAGATRPRDEIQDAEIVPTPEAWAIDFVPANETEVNLLAAAEANNTDTFLSTLLLARIILPVPISMPPGSRPRDKYFPWQIEELDGQRFIAVFTSPDRMSEYGQSRFGSDISSMSMRFIELIASWPSERTSFAINPGSPVGATLPGSQIVALASWAAEVGLRDEPSAEVVVAPKKNESVPSLGVAGAPTAGAAQATIMQRTVPPSQLAFYLERGYDRVSGFVNRAKEVAHLTSPRALYRALGLVYSGSPFRDDDAAVHVLRWVAHRADLYRLPYGGQHEAAMRAMQGWVIERAPFRGNGFAPGDTDVVTEFKVDSVRLPHGAQMWRLTQDGTETLVASFDADSGRWVQTP